MTPFFSIIVPCCDVARFVKLFVRHPSLAWIADVFFRFAYNPLSGLKES